MTNTDESDFAQRHPKDGDKFKTLVHRVRPNWSVTAFSVKDSIFPKDIGSYDGVIVTGSPASVHDTDPWVAQLLDLIRTAFASHIPMFGACYGHQAIAKALGGQVGPNPGGWVFGLTQAQIVSKPEWMRSLPNEFKQYGAHIEQVTKLPEGAEVLTSTTDCPIAGFRIGDCVYTTQNHPEMTADFMSALVAEYASKLPVDVAQAAKASLADPAHNEAFAHTIATFFEQASIH